MQTLAKFEELRQGFSIILSEKREKKEKKIKSQRKSVLPCK